VLAYGYCSELYNDKHPIPVDVIHFAPMQITAAPPTWAPSWVGYTSCAMRVSPPRGIFHAASRRIRSNSASMSHSYSGRDANVARLVMHVTHRNALVVVQTVTSHGTVPVQCFGEDIPALVVDLSKNLKDYEGTVNFVFYRTKLLSPLDQRPWCTKRTRTGSARPRWSI